MRSAPRQPPPSRTSPRRGVAAWTAGPAPVLGAPSRLAPLLVITVIASFATGVFWNAIGFIAKEAFGFDAARTLLLFTVTGFTYALAAYLAGDVTARVGRRWSPRTFLAVLLVLLGGSCLLPGLYPRESLLWIAAMLASVVSALLWPLVHAFLSSGRHGRAMRSGIGIFNLTWMSATAFPLLVMGPALERAPLAVLTVLGLLCAPAVLAIPGLPARPLPYDEHLAAGHVPPTYRALAWSARMLLPLSYVLVATLASLAPFRFEAVGVGITLAAAATATWMLARVGMVGWMSASQRWAGRGSTLLLAASLMAGGFALFAVGPTALLLLAGLACFGAGVGAIYHAALYYGMAVGRAEVDAGGRHEALIGLGYALGPGVAWLGAGILRAAGGSPQAGMLLALAVVLVPGLALAARPWWPRGRAVTAAGHGGEA